jgi:hypothetical protein
VWRCVGLGLRVLPLTPQIAFPLQSGDPVFRPPEAGGFVRLCQSDPLPVPDGPLRISSANRNLPARLSRQAVRQRAGSSSNPDPKVTGFIPLAEIIQPWGL